MPNARRHAVPAVVLALLCAGAAPSPGGVARLPLKTLDGETLRLGEVGAKAIVVDVWATWCGPCREALPHLDALAREGAGRGVVVVAAAQDESAGKVRSFVAALGLRSLEVVVDDDHALAEALSPRTLPTTFVLDRSGAVRARFDGYRPGDERKIRAAVERLLADAGAAMDR